MTTTSDSKDTTTKSPSSALSKWKDDIKKDFKKLERDISETLEDISERTMNKLHHAATRKREGNSSSNSNSEHSPLIHHSSDEDKKESSSPSKLEPSAPRKTTDVVVANKEELVSAATINSNSNLSNSNRSSSSSSSRLFYQKLRLIVTTLISISTVYNTYVYKVDIVSNNFSSIPFIVVMHWLLVAYLCGLGCSTTTFWGGGEREMITTSESHDEDGVDFCCEEDKPHLVNECKGYEEEIMKRKEKLSKLFFRRRHLGRRHYAEAKMKMRCLIHMNSNDINDKNYNIITSKGSFDVIEDFFTNLMPAKRQKMSGGEGIGCGGSKGASNLPISERMMNRLLKYSPDFHRRKSLKGEIDVKSILKRLEGGNDLSDEEDDEGAEEEAVGENYEIGTAPLINKRASKLERKFDYVEPLCKFRGMDFFIGDFPEKEIWKQPLLLKHGLRDAPTLIGNLMLPQGNLTSYLQLPDWFDDWDNIPDEKEDDPPDIKAFKRFFAGDLDYQRRRAKIVPCVVKAPYLVKIISPDPTEMTMHTPRHPVSIKKVNKVVDKSTGKTTAAALMEVGVDFYSSAAIGRIINIVMPHLGSITIDVALVVAPPWGATGDEKKEPSACIGVWRIDKVDFTRCAQLPEKPMEEVEEELKKAMKSFVAEEQSMWTEMEVAA